MNEEVRIARINELKTKIHEIKYPFMAGGLNEDVNGGDLAQNQHQSKIYSQLKPSGKIKFMSAYRFFRKEMVPLIKRLEPDLDSKGRHHVVHNVWTQLHDQHKLAYVLMSRADREKSLYIIRLNQIREELRSAYPKEFHEIQKQKDDQKPNESTASTT